MIVVDTNVLSELMRESGSERVRAWVDARATAELFVTTISQAEILYGIALVPRGKRRDRLAHAANAMFTEGFSNRLLPFGPDAAVHFADIVAARRRAGRPIAAFDAQIAAIVRSHDATLATRNVNDFAACGFEVVDPWRAA